MEGTSPGGRRPGGRYLAKFEHLWRGLGLELARWEPDPAKAGFCGVDDHVLFVTFAGRTGRTMAWIEGGHRYDGADFPGAVTFIPANHRRNAWHQGGTIEYATIRISPRHPALGAGERGHRQAEYRGFTNRPDPFIHQLALALRAEARTGGPGGPLFVDSVATALSLHLVRQFSSLSPLRAARRPALQGVRLRCVLDHIQENLSSDLRLARLAQVADMDRWHFSRAFKESTGVPPHQYVTARRIDRAAELLARSDLPIVDIAAVVGFSSQSHLTTVFRKAIGDTPHAYRSTRRSR